MKLINSSDKTQDKLQQSQEAILKFFKFLVGKINYGGKIQKVED